MIEGETWGCGTDRQTNQLVQHARNFAKSDRQGRIDRPFVCTAPPPPTGTVELSGLFGEKTRPGRMEDGLRGPLWVIGEQTMVRRKSITMVHLVRLLLYLDMDATLFLLFSLLACGLVMLVVGMDSPRDVRGDGMFVDEAMWADCRATTPKRTKKVRQGGKESDQLLFWNNS